MNSTIILNREDLGSVSYWGHPERLSVRCGRYIYSMSKRDVHCYTSQCTEAWVVEGFICNTTADLKKAIRILRNNVPVNRIIKHAIAARMRYGLSLEDVNNLRATLMSLKA